jgi:hypothetical protein
VQLNREATRVLGSARIGMLALRSGRMPLVNPAAFHFASGSVWMTTSRFAVKTFLARRDPRAAFFVDGGSRAVLLRGRLEQFDPLSVSAQARALLGGPSLYFGMLGYTLKNAPFIGGYLLDLARIPREWLPYNRVVLRLVVSDAELVQEPSFPEAQVARVPGVPAEIGRQLAGVTRGYACWLEAAARAMAPVARSWSSRITLTGRRSWLGRAFAARSVPRPARKPSPIATASRSTRCPRRSISRPSG